MKAYIHHAAYYTGRLDWYILFFETVFSLKMTRERKQSDGLREVWLEGGIQLCETRDEVLQDGRGAHLCLIVEDLESAREKALGLGCEEMPKHHWLKLPDGLCLELFEAADGAVEAMDRLVKRK